MSLSAVACGLPDEPPEPAAVDDPALPELDAPLPSALAPLPAPDLEPELDAPGPLF